VYRTMVCCAIVNHVQTVEGAISYDHVTPAVRRRFR
jgi:hypothetical protein